MDSKQGWEKVEDMKEVFMPGLNKFVDRSCKTPPAIQILSVV